MPHLLDVENPERRDGPRVRVAGVRLSVQRGEVVGLLGLNGAGKSTTLSAIAGVLAPTKGSIRIEGVDIARDPGRAKALLDFLPEMPLETGVLINIPAATQYLPPVPLITAPISGTVISQGEWITLEGIAEFGNPPYTPEWSSSEAGFLGTGKTLPVVLWPYGRTDSAPQLITLTVTDANGQSGSASILVYVTPKVFLPMMIR